MNADSTVLERLFCSLRLIVVVGSALPGAQQDKAAIDKLYNAAKKEGRVVIWGPTDGDCL